MSKDCFVSAACSYKCPNNEMDAYDEWFGYGLAEDLGYEKIKCSDCHYNTGECKDCLFEDSKDCPERRNHEVHGDGGY